MDGNTINKLLRYHPEFQGVFARNTLPYFIPNNSGLIVNTDPNTLKGTHWVAIFKDMDGYCEYFDPFGIPPLYDEYMTFLNNNSSVGYRWSQQQLQCVECITCGYYCVEYLKFRFSGFTLKHLLHSFTLNPYINDTIVKNRISNTII